MATPRHFTSPLDLHAATGLRLGPTDWTVVDQPRIDRFAEATDDLQWIHTDPGRAAAGPFGTTIAHGWLTVSLLPSFEAQLVEVGGATMGVNCGADRIRFLAPVPSGSRLRATATVDEVKDVAGGVQVVLAVEVEAEGADRPVCAARTISRYYLAD
ncbi:MaoC family dehydratase [Kitasatospora saccharophila]|uniref:MaoC family dehydratase n=1 Tax=Kitasatospora saccharophila TaxID=407973 RepID=A0ABP5JGR6_9ACTN